MIRVLVLYPNNGNQKFDIDYYKNNHIPLVKEKLNPTKVEVDFGIQNPEQPSPYLAVSHLYFESIEKLMEVYAPAAQEINEDIQKFTDIEFIVQISEIIDM